MVTASIQMGTSVTIKPNFKPKMITSALVVFFAPCKKAQLERPVWLVHKGGGNGDGGVVVREVEPPQQGDHQHMHLHLCNPPSNAHPWSVAKRKEVCRGGGACAGDHLAEEE